MTRLSLIPLCLTLATPAFAEWPAVAEPNGTLSGSIGDVPFDLPVYCNTDPMMPFYVVQSHENLSQSRGPSDGTVAAMVMFNAPYATVLIFTGAEDPYAFGLSGEPLYGWGV
jgi:hypothetical protein